MTKKGPAQEKGARHLRPLLRWAGSKRQLLAPLAEALPPPNYVYVEPFCGSAALFFKMQPTQAILADINRDLINFYKLCQDTPLDVFNIARTLRRNKSIYYDIRSAIHTMPFDATRAAYFFS
jgi:DNA adenine methylase